MAQSGYDSSRFLRKRGSGRACGTGPGGGQGSACAPRPPGGLAVRLRASALPSLCLPPQNHQLKGAFQFRPSVGLFLTEIALPPTL